MKDLLTAIVPAPESATVPEATYTPGCTAEQNSAELLSGRTKVALARLRKAVRRVLTQLGFVPPILGAALREIFDESAYARFLDHRQLTSSRAAYAVFCQENDAAKARRPKCC